MKRIKDKIEDIVDGAVSFLQEAGMPNAALRAVHQKRVDIVQVGSRNCSYKIGPVFVTVYALTIA